jgi:hypothetical protein
MRFIPITLLIPAISLLIGGCEGSYPSPYDEKEGEGQHHYKRSLFLDLQHRAAPGVDWRRENERVVVEAYLEQASMGERPPGPGLFANGKIKAQWMERGSLNQAGSFGAMDYDPVGDKIYGISDGGTLWRGSLAGNDWVPLNADLRFNPGMIQVLRLTNGTLRVLALIGKKVWYSDNEGQSFTEASGFSFYDGWGRPIQLMVAREGGTNHVYYSVQTWDAGPWAARVQLYYSSNGGQHFSLVSTLTHGNADRVSMWNPPGTADVYLLNQSTRIFKWSAASLSIWVNSTNLPTNVRCQIHGHRSDAGVLTLYALLNSKDLYRSTNNGVSWVLRSTLPDGAWSVGIEVSRSDPNRLAFGAVNSYRSTDGGATWILINEWWEYYGNVAGKLHADIMEIAYFRKSNNQEFALISNHGGISVSYNFFVTNQNLALSNLNISQYYDVRTDPTDPRYLYAGTQDQGYQRASTANILPFGPLNFNQIVSGDYGHMVFSGNGQRLWKQYPGGDFTYHHFPKTSNNWSDSGWKLTGDHLPNVGWLVPTAEFSHNPALNKILVGGGNIQGGPGSHLIELTALNQAPYTITGSQDAFDFRANSNSGSSAISALAVQAGSGRYYVATEDGTFFRKNQNGSWQKAAGFNGPDGNYLYGAHILPSRINAEVVWFCGSGYSNPPVWRSTDGGQTFTAMSDGLPATLVQEMATTPDEKFIFAATDAGPYVYDVESGWWTSLKDPTFPMQTVYSVEFVAPHNLVRFGTFGRGIWDFVLDNLQVSGTAYPATCDASSGEIVLKVSGGFPPLVYEWATGATGPYLGYLNAGIYTVTVTDANGFSRELPFSVAGAGKPPKPHDLSVTAAPCGPALIKWSGPLLGSYQLRYRDASNSGWTVVGDIGQITQFSLPFFPNSGSVQVALRYVCGSGSQSAWVPLSFNWPACASALAASRGDEETPQTRIFPNPASETTWVRGFSGVLRCYDSQGVLVREYGQVGPEAFAMDVSNWKSGLYWLTDSQGAMNRLLVSH